MIAKIISFELSRRYKSWITIILYFLLIFQGIWYTKGVYDMYTNEDILMNSAATFYKNLAGSGIFMIIIVAIITGPILFKDVQYHTGQWLYSKLTQEKKFFTGKFLSAFLINSLLGIGYAFGMLITPYAGIGEPHQFGAYNVGQLFHGYLFLLVPNLLLLTGLVFFGLTYTRKMATGYFAVIATTIIFLLMETTTQASGATPMLMILDPFGYVASDHYLSLLSLEEKNTGYLAFEGYLLINRILWLSISILLFVLSYQKFSFKQFLKPTGKAKKTKIKLNESLSNVLPKSRSLKVNLDFSNFTFIKKLFALSVLEFKNLTRPSGFKVIIGVVILMNILQNLLWNDSYYIGSTEPLTFTMTNFRLAFGAFIMTLLIIWAGELFFKDRITDFWQIADAMPIPIWVTTFSRFLAMVGLSFILASTFMLTGILVQTLKGGIGLIDFPLYMYDMWGYNWGWLTYVLQIALVFFVAGLFKNRFLTHILCAGIFFITLMGFELGLLEQLIYGYSFVPGVENYSEVNAYGVWKTAAFWYFLMWSMLAISFVLAGIWFWQRGSSPKLSKTFSLKNPQLSLFGKIALVFFLGLFVSLRFFITSQVNDKGNFTASHIEENQKANYEKKYSYLKKIAQPQYKHIDLNLDLFPAERKAVYEAKIELSNPEKLDTLYLNFADFVVVESLKINDIALKKSWKDEDQDLSAWAIPTSMQNDKKLILQIKASKKYVGFLQGAEHDQYDLIQNGSFGSIRQFLPVIGYEDEKELKENRVRINQGLPRLESTLPKIDDKVGLKSSFFASDAEQVTANITLSTSKGQTAIAPGKFIKKWEKDKRSYFQYEITEPSEFDWYIASANYDKHSFEYKKVKVEILHDPKHPFNLELYEKATKKAFAFLEENLSAFPAQELRIIEIPPYQDDFYSFPNTIAISEKEGWYASNTNLKEQAYIYQTVATQIYKQWLYANLKIANVQGASMLKTALPEGLALQFLEKELGKEAVEFILEAKNGQYVKGANVASNKEPALLYADDTDYLEVNKGAMEMYKLISEVGAKPFYQNLKTWLKKSPNEYKTFLDFFNILKPELSKETVKNFEETK